MWLGSLEELLFFQLRDEFGPALLDRIVSGLGKGGERERFEDWHVGSPLLDGTSPILITSMSLYMPARNSRKVTRKQELTSSVAR